jgi:hypothetical protein
LEIFLCNTSISSLVKCPIHINPILHCLVLFILYFSPFTYTAS